MMNLNIFGSVFQNNMDIDADGTCKIVRKDKIEAGQWDSVINGCPSN